MLITAINNIVIGYLEALEKGTSYQLKMLLNNPSALDPTKNLQYCEDFLLIALHGQSYSSSS